MAELEESKEEDLPTSAVTLCDRYRLTADWRLILLLLYTPLGVILLIVRLFLSLQLFIIATVLPKSLLLRRIALRGCSAVLGLFVTMDGLDNRDANCHVVICNHLCVLDHCALETVLPTYQVPQLCQSKTVSWFWSEKKLGTSNRHEDVMDRAKEHCRAEGCVPLLIFPERATTSGRVGLLKFSLPAFQLDVPIQPVALTIYRPSFLPVAISTVDSSGLADFLWCLFCPFALYYIRLLPVVNPVSGETAESFAEKTQQMMADVLNLQATRLQLTVPNRTQRLDPRLAGMVQQVREVLPHVPADVVHRDLQRTRCVDTTISNIMEGTIQFTPEPVPAAVHVKQGTSIKIAASDKGKRQSGGSQTVSYHNLSFNDRKKAFIEEARRRYLEKHGPSSSDR